MTVSDSWGLFTQNIFPGKISFKNSTQGGETVSFENNTFITLDCLSLSDRNKIVVVFQKFKFEKSSAKIKIFILKIDYPSLRPPQKSHNADGFSNFREKLETFLQTIMLCIIEYDWNIFFSSVLGVTFLIKV